MGDDEPDLLQRAVLSFPSSTSELAQAPLGALPWNDLLRWATDERVVGQLWHASQQVIPVTDEQQVEITGVQRSTSALTMVVESSIPSIASLLGDAGVDWRILKGVATARLLYPDPSWRQYGDVDILVRPQDLESALAALSPITTQAPPIQAGPTRTQLVKERPIVDLRGMEIDVHFAIEGSLVNSRLPIEPLFAEPQSITVMATEVLTMSNAALLVHAGLHLTSLGTRLSTVPDVVRLAAIVGPADPMIAQVTEERSVRDLFVWSLLLADSWVSIPPEWREYCERHRPSRATMRWYVWMHASSARIRMSNAVLGPKRLRRMRESAWPSRPFLDELGITRVGNVARIARTIGDVRRPSDEP